MLICFAPVTWKILVACQSNWKLVVSSQGLAKSHGLRNN